MVVITVVTMAVMVGPEVEEVYQKAVPIIQQLVVQEQQVKVMMEAVVVVDLVYITVEEAVEELVK